MRGLFANELRHYQIVGAGGSHINANREQAALHLTATSDSFWPELLVRDRTRKRSPAAIASFRNGRCRRARATNAPGQFQSMATGGFLASHRIIVATMKDVPGLHD